MAINIESRKQEAGGRRGFALLVAIIFMSVMLSFGLALGSLAYKQQVLASYTVESQYAFYAADTALECALFADSPSQNLFAYPTPEPSSAPLMTCNGVSAIYPPTNSTGIVSYTSSPPQWVITERFSFSPVNDTQVSASGLMAGARCADVTVYKPQPGAGKTYVFSQGYDVSCAALAAGGARFVTRGLSAQY